MKTKATLNSLALRVHLIIAMAATVMMAFAPSSRAGLNGPYTNDFYTLHLWHLQDTSGTIPGVATNGVYFNDSGINSLVVPLLVSNTPGPDLISLTASSTDFALAGQPGPGVPLAALYGTNFGYALSIQNTQYTGFYAPWVNVANNDYPDLSYAMTNNSCSFVNTNTGAFTWEALIQPNFNPLTDTADKNPEILCSDGPNNTILNTSPYTTRATQFRFDNDTGPSGVELEFNGNISVSPASQIHDAIGFLPATGPDAVAQGTWYHVAVAFTGTAPTNGDPPHVLTLYWTKLDASRTNADVLTNYNYFFTITNTGAGTVSTLAYPSNSIIGGGPFVIGNSARLGGGGLMNGGWVGNIAEVRISDCYRHSNEFMFNTVSVVGPPSPSPLPTNSLVGYGQSLNFNLLVSGSLNGIGYQWYQVAGGVTNALAGQTTSSLSLSNLTYAANNINYFAIITNLYGSATSTVASVTVGANFDALFNTGCGPQYNPLDQTAPGSVDLHWMFPAGGNPDNNSPNAIVWSDGSPLQSGGGLGPNNGASVWIWAHENSGKVANTYSLQTTFQVDETVVSPTNGISGTVGVLGALGGETLQMFLNGVETDFTTPANPAETVLQFTITNGLQAGSNTLVCTAYQSGSGSAGNNGFNMDIISDVGPALTTAPAIINQPAGVTNTYGSTVSFQAVALGAPPLTYYWLSNGVAVTPPTWVYTANPYLSFVATNISLSQLVGTNYFANVQIVFSNFVGVVTSSVAPLNIQLPSLALASAGVPIWNVATNETNIVVNFSTSVDPVSATTAGNYSLNNGASVLSAALGSAPGEVILTTTILNPATSYTLTVQNVNSSLGIALSPSPASVAVGVYPANVALWIKSSIGVTTDGTGTNVTQWNDLSGNGNNLTCPSSPPFEPLLITNALGYPVIRFIATNETYMQAADVPSLEITSNMSVFAVINFATLVGGTNGDIVSKTANNSFAAPYDYYANTGAVQFFRGNGSTYVDVHSTAPPSVGIPHILDVVMQGTSVIHRLDGTANGTGTLSTPIADGGDGSPLYIGTRYDQGSRLSGDMYELIVIGSALSSSDSASMEKYLTTEYSSAFVPPINANPTNLVFLAKNNQLTLTWPADHTGWQLQAQTNVLSVGINTNWVNVTGSTVTNQVVIPINLTNGSVFYRLIYTP